MLPCCDGEIKLYIKQVAPPSNKIKTRDFHLQNQARAVHSNAPIFKIPAPVCTILNIMTFWIGYMYAHYIIIINFLIQSDNNLLFG